MRQLSVVVAIVLASFIAGCVITPDGVEQKEVVLSDVFPPSKTVASYRRVGRPLPIKGKELEAHFGGKRKLEVLRKWGTFTSMVCEYGLPKRKPKVRLTITEMATKFKAYGAYTNLRPGLLPKKQYVKIGISATIDGERLLFIQDRFVIMVRDLSNAPDEQRRALLINFAQKISNRIPRAITDIDPVTFLPYSHRVPASERLDMEDPLGLSIFKNGAVTALYRYQGRECKVFLAALQETWRKRKSLHELKAALGKKSKVFELAIGDEGYEGKLFGKRCMVAQRKAVVFGAFGTFTEKEMRQMLATIDRRIKPFVPKQYKEKQQDDDESGGHSLYE